ncbi:hypothetical protein [Xanthomonas phage Tabio]|nr:hypothetical protein [Xanthomonas phage Tabio]CAA2393674.1 Phage protein [Xanthomonas phage Sopo]
MSREASLEAALRLMMDAVGQPPKPNCSCHLSPPCSDCVEWGGLREAWADAESALEDPADLAAGSLPQRDQARPATEQGLFQKYRVERVDGKAEAHQGCEYFVLDVTHDPHANTALATYASAVEETHPALAADMRERYGVSRDRWAALEKELADRYQLCNDGAATPSSILLAVLNAVASARKA